MSGPGGWVTVSAAGGAHSHRPMLDLILFLFYSYRVKQNKLFNIFIFVLHTSISEWRSEVSVWSVIGLTPRACLLSRPRAIFQACMWTRKFGGKPAALVYYKRRDCSIQSLQQRTFKL